MHNLFPTETWMEELEDASKGEMDYTAPGALKGRNYVVPLITMPEYTGDFLDKLRTQQQLQGKPIEAADNENLWDFTMPSEWLKHQEKPSVRVLTDEFYEMGRPGDKDDGSQSGTGYEDLKEYWDRSWDGEAPEVSEDLIERLDNPFTELNCDRDFSAATRVASNFFRGFGHFANENVKIVGKVGQNPHPAVPGELLDPYRHHVNSHAVVSRFLIERFPVDAILDTRRVRYAKLLEDLRKTQITTKSKGTRDLDLKGVRVVIMKKEPQLGRWTFTTGAEGNTYTTIFQFIPHGKEMDVNKLHVQVTCNCPSWIFWGAQYNAYIGKYLYGKTYPVLGKATKRDPQGKFLVCKHVLACIPWITKFTLDQKMPKDVRDRLQRLHEEPRTEMEKAELPTTLRMPPDLRVYGDARRYPEIKEVVKKWGFMNDREREEYIDSFDSPGPVAYFAHLFPQTAADFAIDKLREIVLHHRTPSFRNLARRYLQFWLG